MMNLLCTKYRNLWFVSDEGAQILHWLCAVCLGAMRICVCAWSHDYWPCSSQTQMWWAVIDCSDQIPAPLSCCPKCSENASFIQNTSVEFLHSSCWFWQSWVPRHSETTAAFVVEYRVPPLRDGQCSVKPFFKMADTANACSRVCLKAGPLMLLQWKLILKSRGILKCYACAINADNLQPTRLSVARVCVLTLGILKKLCIIQCVHWFIDFSSNCRWESKLAAMSVCVFVIYWVIYLE